MPISDTDEFRNDQQKAGVEVPGAPCKQMMRVRADGFNLEAIPCPQDGPNKWVVCKDHIVGTA